MPVRVYAGTPRYLQGPGALELLPEVTAAHPGAPMIITDPLIRDLLGRQLAALLPAAQFHVLDGEVTAANADHIAAIARSGDHEIGVVIGVGGGKSLDAAKAVALRLNLPVVTVPSAASNDSPASAAIAMYDTDHVMVGVDRLPHHPETVVVDTELIAKAPVALLRAGLGDAVSKAFEAQACLAGRGLTAHGTRPLQIGLAIAAAGYESIRRYGLAGLAACERGEATMELEHLIEAVILMSGLGFENGGLSLAHSLTRGLMPARGAKYAPHGAHVAWGLLVQLTVEGREDERMDIGAFLSAAGLPTSLHELGLTAPTSAEIDEIVRLTLRSPHMANTPVPVTDHVLRGAILRVEHPC